MSNEIARIEEHRLAAEIGFYSARVWWIDSIHRDPKSVYYKYWIDGRNGFDGDERIYWNVPQIAGRPYAFALKLTA